jgi:hypothetical protein
MTCGERRISGHNGEADGLGRAVENLAWSRSLNWRYGPTIATALLRVNTGITLHYARLWGISAGEGLRWEDKTLDWIPDRRCAFSGMTTQSERGGATGDRCLPQRANRRLASQGGTLAKARDAENANARSHTKRKGWGRKAPLYKSGRRKSRKVGVEGNWKVGYALARAGRTHSQHALQSAERGGVRD